MCASYFSSIRYWGSLRLQVKQPKYLLGQFVRSHYGRFSLVGKPQESQAANHPVVVLCCWQAILYHKIFSASTRIRMELESY